MPVFNTIGSGVRSAKRGAATWVASVVAGVMIAGSLVAFGVGAQMALAAPPAPQVGAAQVDAPLVAGSEGSLSVTFSNPAGDSVGEFNLSAMLVLPEGVKVTNYGGLGAPTKVYTSADGPLPGNYGAADCLAFGLVQAAAPNTSKCAVPDGQQLFVFENISDLPQGASNTASLTLLPDASVFEPGSDIPYTLTGFTSANANLIPVFPGSSSKAANADHTSAPGAVAGKVRVEALRIAKAEPSLEDELLRGVHDHQTVYTLRVSHTGEGDVSNAKVIDYLPAGLEYLGSGQTDNTQQANGNRDEFEYPDSGTIAGKVVKPANWFKEESIVTIVASAEEAEKFGLVEGAVYTKVTWDLKTLLAAGGSDGGSGTEITGGAGQDFAAGTAGTAGVIELQYVAGIPLFENVVVDGSFDGDVAGPNGALNQGSNLDNNRGASTRHGAKTPATQATAGAKVFTNVATVSGDYTLKNPIDPQDPIYSSSAHDAERVEAVDVRIYKTVNGSQDGSFVQGEHARYNLNLATSEYVQATLPENPENGGIRPYRLVDDLGDGMCPIFPAGTAITPNASTIAGIPNLILGDPNPGGGPYEQNMTVDDWNAKLAAAGVDGNCAYPSASAASPADALTGATLTGVGFNTTSGHFFIDFQLDAAGAGAGALNEANGEHNIGYSTLLQRHYDASSKPGQTSSGDRVTNTVEVYAETHSIPNLDGVTSLDGADAFGDYDAWDDSQAALSAEEGSLKKQVLPRSAGPKTAANIVGVADGIWEDDRAPEPFAAGDEVWYKISIPAPKYNDVRNPKLTDFLPVGVSLAGGVLTPGGNYVFVPPATLKNVGTCAATATSNPTWVDKYVPAPVVSGQSITWTLGSNSCVTENTTDRFLPIDSDLTFYIKGIVTGTSAAATQDLPQNLAKYQQQGRLGEDGEYEIFFLRDAAEIELVTTPELIKGIQGNTFAGITGLPTSGDDAWKGSGVGPNYPAGSNSNQFWSDVDGEYAVQQDEITFRVDVQSPMGNSDGTVTTKDYVVWDALPEGVKKADLKGYTPTTNDFTGSVTLVKNGVETALDAGKFTAQVYDFEDYNVVAPATPPAGLGDLRADIKDAKRSVIVWTVSEEIKGSKRGETTEINGFSLHYTVVVPSDSNNPRRDALLEQQYTNTASIVQYDAATQTSTSDSTTTLVPFGDDTLRDNGTENQPSLPTGAVAVPQTDTFDDSDFKIPNAAMQKKLVSTEIAGDSTTPQDPNNPKNVIVQGEYATYDISVRIPANTTVRNGVLADNGTLLGTGGGTALNPSSAKYQVQSATITSGNGNTVISIDSDQAADPRNFKFNTKTGKLIFPEYYQNTTADAQIFTVQLVLWVNDIDASNPVSSGPPAVPNADRPQIPNDKGLRNTAKFDSQNVAGGKNTTLQDTADVIYREPDLQILKSADKTTNVNIDDTVTYTLEVKNVNRVKSYDNVVVDTIPAGLLVQTDSFKIGTSSVVGDASTVPDLSLIIAPGATDGTGGTITWDSAETVLSELAEVPESVFLFYQAKIDPTTGAGQVYTNTAKVTGYTLPATIDSTTTENRRGDRVSTANRDITATSAGIDKTVRIKGDTNYTETVSAPIGQTVQYKVDVTLNANINYYDIEVRDALSAGVELQTGTVEVAMKTGSAAPVDVTSNWTRSGTDPNHVWKYSATGAGGDLTSSTDVRVLTFTYDVLLKNTVADGVISLPNTAGVTWATTNGGDLRDPITDPAGVTVLNPALQIVKKVDGEDSITRDPGASFDYTLTVSQTAQGNTPAFAIKVQDVVPEGVVVTPGTISNGGTLSGAGANGGGTITWTLAGPLNHTAAGAPTAIVLGYTAKFADSTTLNTTALENVANVTHFESFVEQGRSYDPPLTGTGSIRDTADVTPLFPKVDPVKTVTNPVDGEDYGLAYVDTPFGWTLTITNNGTGVAKTADVVDTLPQNWSYVAGSAKVNNQTLVDPTEDPTSGSTTTLTWTTGELKDAIANLFPLAAGGKFVITFDAQPGETAIDTPGTGLPVGGTGGKAHVNTVKVTNVTDTQDKPSNKDGGYAGVDDTANAYIAEADLLLEKAAIGGTDAAIELSNDETLPEGSWIAGAIDGQLINGTVGYTQPQWQLTVTNHGPDASFGAFTVAEQQTLPAGVTVTGWQAKYFAVGATTGTALPVTVAGSGANLTLTVGDATTSLNAEGTDRIVITANVNVPAGTIATAADLKNIATVEGVTFERDANKVPPHEYPNTA